MKVFFGCLFMVLAGLLLLPVVRAKISAVKPQLQSKWLSVGVFVLLLCSGLSLQASEDRALKNGTASQELLDREAQRKEDNQGRERLSAEKEAKEASQKQLREIEEQQRSSMIAIQTDSRIALMNYLKDPDSADIRTHRGNCGEVNSKNGFGGYTGFKRFIASSAIVAIEGENMDSNEFQKA
ncbi:MAG: hypothetical protein RSB25_10785 [Acinetobacter sp.]